MSTAAAEAAAPVAPRRDGAVVVALEDPSREEPAADDSQAQQTTGDAGQETARIRGNMTRGQQVATQVGAFFLGTLMNWTGKGAWPFLHLPHLRALRPSSPLADVIMHILRRHHRIPQLAAFWCALVTYLLYLPVLKLCPTCTRTLRFLHGLAHRPTMARGDERREPSPPA